jgi:hypothetical protein
MASPGGGAKKLDIMFCFVVLCVQEVEMMEKIIGQRRSGTHTDGMRGLSIPILRKMLVDMECMRCGAYCFHENLIIHHINENYKDHYLNNLAVLCKRCHRAVHTCEDKRRNGSGETSRHRYRTNSRSYGKMSYEERFNKKHSKIGGVEGFRRLYRNREVSTTEIGHHMGVSRERVRQIAIRLGERTRREGEGR